MRLAPIPMFFFPDVDMAEHYARESCRTTHGAVECIDTCRLQARVICRALLGCSKNEVLLGDRNTFVSSKKITAVANGAYLEKDEADIRGSGYVVETLEAAMWCFARAESFKEAVLMAVNLGDDADTTGAVCGQIAGAYYGANGIPKAWIERLALRESIIGLADRLYDATMKRAG
jgi:ADP-ribosyl-[dinitrogen reductase] hydrolase